MRSVSLEIGRSSIDGQGLFAIKPIRRRQKVGELVGERISQSEARRRARHQERIAIVELEDGTAIDARSGGNEFRYINHSCSPNTFMRVCRGHIEFYALRDINPGEELTCDYGETHHDGTLPCRCGSRHCRGSI